MSSPVDISWLVIYSLFNDAVNGPNYDRMISEYWLNKECVKQLAWPFLVTIQTFSWKDWGHREKNQVTLACHRTIIWMQDIPLRRRRTTHSTATLSFLLSLLLLSSSLSSTSSSLSSLPPPASYLLYIIPLCEWVTVWLVRQPLLLGCVFCVRYALRSKKQLSIKHVITT